MESISVEDVFVPGGIPDKTYIQRALPLHDQIDRALALGTKVICISGPTKTGKTVLAEKTISKDNRFWVPGAQISSLDDLYDHILYAGKAITRTTTQHAVATTQGMKSVLGVSSEFLNLALELESRIHTALSTEKESASLKSTVAFETLKKLKRTLVIDDFHHLDEVLRLRILRQVKDFVRNRVPVVLITINSSIFDPLTTDIEMQGRTLSINVPTWKDSELIQIANRGFLSLSFAVDAQDIKLLSRNAFKSPFLMQDFCLNWCIERKRFTGNKFVIESLVPPESWNRFFRQFCDNASNTYTPLIKGPSPHGKSRRVRYLKDGTSGDLYYLIHRCLGEKMPPMKVTVDSFMKIMRGMCIDGLPNRQEAVRALKKIADTDTSMGHEPRIRFHTNADAIEILDPYLALFLKYGDLQMK